MKNRTLKGMMVAAGVVGLLATGYGFAQQGGKKAEAKMVKCHGINACAGKGECGAKDGSHDCAGKNSCKGKGWVKATAKECKDKGGEILEDKKSE